MDDDPTNRDLILGLHKKVNRLETTIILALIINAIITGAIVRGWI